MAETTYYVDTDVVGGEADGSSWVNAFSHLSEAEALNLDISSGEYEGDCTIHCRGTTADTTQVTWDGWTTTGYGVYIIGDESTGKWNTSAYRMTHANDECLIIFDDNIHLSHLQFQIDSLVAENAACIQITNHTGIEIDSCILRGGNDGVREYGISIDGVDATVNVYNTIIYGGDTTQVGSSGIIATCLTLNVFNCTVDGYRYSFNRDGGTVTVKNTHCLRYGNTDFDGTITADYCMTTDGSGDNPQTPQGDDWDNEFTDKDNGDYSLKAGGNSIGNGTDNPGSGLYSDDIIGTARSSTWDIGAYENVAAGGSSIPTMMSYYRRLRS